MAADPSGLDAGWAQSPVAWDPYGEKLANLQGTDRILQTFCPPNSGALDYGFGNDGTNQAFQNAFDELGDSARTFAFFYAMGTISGPGGAGGKRTKNHLSPDPMAGSAPHTTFRRDPVTGKITHYESYRPGNPGDPVPLRAYKRFDGEGAAHTDKVTNSTVPTPHINFPDKSRGRGAPLSRARPPRNYEKPTGY